LIGVLGVQRGTTVGISVTLNNFAVILNGELVLTAVSDGLEVESTFVLGGIAEFSELSGVIASLSQKRTSSVLTPEKRFSFTVINGIPSRIFQKSHSKFRESSIINSRGSHNFIIKNSSFPMGS